MKLLCIVVAALALISSGNGKPGKPPSPHDQAVTGFNEFIDSLLIKNDTGKTERNENAKPGKPPSPYEQGVTDFNEFIDSLQIHNGTAKPAKRQFIDPQAEAIMRCCLETFGNQGGFIAILQCLMSGGNLCAESGPGSGPKPDNSSGSGNATSGTAGSGNAGSGNANNGSTPTGGSGSAGSGNANNGSTPTGGSGSAGSGNANNGSTPTAGSGSAGSGSANNGSTPTGGSGSSNETSGTAKPAKRQFIDPQAEAIMRCCLETFGNQGGFIAILQCLMSSGNLCAEGSQSFGPHPDNSSGSGNATSGTGGSGSAGSGNANNDSTPTGGSGSSNETSGSAKPARSQVIDSQAEDNNAFGSRGGIIILGKWFISERFPSEKNNLARTQRMIPVLQCFMTGGKSCTFSNPEGGPDFGPGPNPDFGNFTGLANASSDNAWPGMSWPGNVWSGNSSSDSTPTSGSGSSNETSEAGKPARRQFFMDRQAQAVSQCCINTFGNQGVMAVIRCFFGGGEACASSKPDGGTASGSGPKPDDKPGSGSAGSGSASTSGSGSGSSTESSELPACGKVPKSTRSLLDRDGRVVGGKEAKAGTIPWIVALMIHDPDYRRQSFCGATVYKKNYLITAAHCFMRPPLDKPDYLEAVVAEHDLGGKEGPEQTIKIEKIIRHEKFNPKIMKDDIAILKLAKPIKFSGQKVAPACLPTSCDLKVKKCQIAGWGKTSDGGDSSQILLMANTTIVDGSECEYMYGGKVNKKKEICASRAGIDTCEGDSGGPFTCEIDGAHQLIGVVSWGFSCASPIFPGVYTRVCNYLDWIKRHTAE